MTKTILIYHTSRANEYLGYLQPQLPDARLLAASNPQEAERLIDEIDILFGWRFPAELFPLAGRLKWVQSLGAGVEDLVAAPLPPGCLLTRVEGLFGPYMAEYALAHMLAQTQQLQRGYQNQAERNWAPYQVGKLQGKRLGVAGVGSIGAEVAKRGKAFGMEVWALSRTGRPLESADRSFAASEVDAFTAGADYLVNVLPLTPETRELIDPTKMKEGALLINMGRGATLSETALLEAVRAGRIQAVLDVFATEPLPEGHPFWRTPGITVTPHISGPSVPVEVAAYCAENFARYVSGQPLVGLVDRERGY